MPLFSGEMILEKEIKAIVEAYPADVRHALAIMQDLQQRFNHIPREALAVIAGHTKSSAAHLYALATFYKALSLKPKGRHIIKICDGTACHIHGAANLMDCIRRELSISPGETTADGEFSLETVNCLGACAIAPVVVIGKTYYGKMTPEKLPQILDIYRMGAKKEAGA